MRINHFLVASLAPLEPSARLQEVRNNVFPSCVLMSKGISLKFFTDDCKPDWQTGELLPPSVNANQPYRLAMLSNHWNANIYPPGEADSVGGGVSCPLLFVGFHEIFLWLKRISEACLAMGRCRWLLEHKAPNRQLFIISSSPALNPHSAALKK